MKCSYLRSGKRNWEKVLTSESESLNINTFSEFLSLYFKSDQHAPLRKLIQALGNTWNPDIYYAEGEVL